MLRNGTAWRSDSPRASPLHLVPKKEDDWRPLWRLSCSECYVNPQPISRSAHYRLCTTSWPENLLHDRFGESMPSDSNSSRRHRKKSHHHALWDFRIPMYVLRAPKRRANISAVHRWGSQRPVFLLLIYRWGAVRLYLGWRARAAPAYIVPALQRVRCLAESSKMCFRREWSDIPWLHSVNCRYSATGWESCNDQSFSTARICQSPQTFPWHAKYLPAVHSTSRQHTSATPRRVSWSQGQMIPTGGLDTHHGPSFRGLQG